MKYLLLAFIVTSALASEKEGETNYCEAYLNQKYRTQREISELTREMIRLHPTHAEEAGPTVKHSEHCEDDSSDLAVLQQRREYLENKIKTLNSEIQRYCPRSRPE